MLRRRAWHKAITYNESLAPLYRRLKPAPQNRKIRMTAPNRF